MNNGEKIGTCLGIFIIAGLTIVTMIFALIMLVYWWNNDTLTMMQVFKYMIRRHPIMFWYMIISTVVCTLAQFKR